MKQLLWLLAPLFIPAAAAAAGPAAEVPPRSVHVFHGDLDLSRDAGAEVLRLRVRAAAREVCSAEGDFELYFIRRACIRGAVRATDERLRELQRQAASSKMRTSSLVVSVVAGALPAEVGRERRGTATARAPALGGDCRRRTQSATVCAARARLEPSGRRMIFRSWR